MHGEDEEDEAIVNVINVLLAEIMCTQNSRRVLSFKETVLALCKRIWY